MSGKHWPEEDKEVLRKLSREGRQLKDIARRMNKTVSAVQNARVRLGIVPRTRHGREHYTQLRFYLSTAHEEIVRQQAHDRGLQVSSYIRALVLAHIDEPPA
jgi:ribosomal protein L13